MNPFFFGTSQQPLLGIHHAPRAQSARKFGVVLCYPMGQEYMRSHRAFRQLAMLLTRAGFHVLRFDYRGTGDSAGDERDASFTRWATDVGLAIEELKDSSGLDEVALVGLRIGASLAASVARERSDVERLVLWDPVLDGKMYVQELLLGSDPVPASAVSARASSRVGVLGFELPATLCASVEGLQFAEVAAATRSHTLLVVSELRPEFARLRDALLVPAGSNEFRCVPSDGSWGTVDNFGSALIPQEIIQHIVAFLAS